MKVLLIILGKLIILAHAVQPSRLQLAGWEAQYPLPTTAVAAGIIVSDLSKMIRISEMEISYAHNNRVGKPK